MCQLWLAKINTFDNQIITYCTIILHLLINRPEPFAFTASRCCIYWLVLERCKNQRELWVVEYEKFAPDDCRVLVSKSAPILDYTNSKLSEIFLNTQLNFFSSAGGAVARMRMWCVRLCACAMRCDSLSEWISQFDSIRLYGIIQWQNARRQIFFVARSNFHVLVAFHISFSHFIFRFSCRIKSRQNRWGLSATVFSKTGHSMFFSFVGLLRSRCLSVASATCAYLYVYTMID